MPNCLSQYATAGEARVARKLIRAALDAGYCISVNDGEETTLRRSSNYHQIVGALATTGADYLTIHDSRSCERAGVFVLIYGNDESGAELIADHWDNVVCCNLYGAVHGDTTKAEA